MLVRLVAGVNKVTQKPDDFFVSNLDKGTKTISFLLQKRLIEDGVIKQIIPYDLTGKTVELIFNESLKKDCLSIDPLEGSVSYTFDGTEFIGETTDKVLTVYVAVYEKDLAGILITSDVVGSFPLSLKVYNFTV